MRWIVTDESLNVSQSIRKRRAVSTAIAEKAETCSEQSLYLCPLLKVFDGWRFERTAHLVDCSAAAGADSRIVLARDDLEALAAVKAGMGNQVLWSWHAIHLQRRLTPELSRPTKWVRLE